MKSDNKNAKNDQKKFTLDTKKENPENLISLELSDEDGVSDLSGVLGSQIQDANEDEISQSNGLVNFDNLDIPDDGETPNGLLDLSAKPTTIAFPNTRDARTEIFRGGKTEIARSAATMIQSSNQQTTAQTKSLVQENSYQSKIEDGENQFSSSEVSEYNEKTKIAYEATEVTGAGSTQHALDLNQKFDRPETMLFDSQEATSNVEQVDQPVAPSMFDAPPVFDSNTANMGGNGLDELDLSVAVQAPEDESSEVVSSLFGDAPVTQDPMMQAPPTSAQNFQDNQDKTMAIHTEPVRSAMISDRQNLGSTSDSTNATGSPQDSDRTVAVTGFHVKHEDDISDKVRISVGQSNRSSSAGYSQWNAGVDGQLNQAENLKIAQEKILDLERENEKIRRQNEQLIAASEIMKERADLLTVQLTEFKNDRDSLEQSFKNEMTLLKNHITRKDAELGKAQFKVDELESKLKFDMKKIRVRERELENRLELIRAEKNAIVKNKDEQILDLRRKIDVLQMEVESYRQKVVELNKQLETSHDSFKRTTRALRLAMANLELHEENKSTFKKAE